MRVRRSSLLHASLAVVALIGSLSSCSHSVADATASVDAALGVGTVSSPLVGTVSALAGTCPTISFVIERKAIRTDGGTSFGEKTCAAVKIGLRVEITGVAQSDGAMLANSVRLLPTSTITPPVPATVSIAGTTHAVTGVCPTLSFTLEARTIRTNAATVFGGGTCANVTDAIKVEIVGQVQSDGSIVASKLAIATVTPPTPTTVTFTGLISAREGTCPDVALRVGDRNVKTTATTVFDGRGCGDDVVGVTVTVTGVLATTSTTVIATKIAAPK